MAERPVAGQRVRPLAQALQAVLRVAAQTLLPAGDLAGRPVVQAAPEDQPDRAADVPATCNP